ncbi:MAG: hypothetical protein JNJ61_08715 [Anaerolineae bacterium]|nr:hypothetical protein [Anaerolineae bacterium]
MRRATYVMLLLLGLFLTAAPVFAQSVSTDGVEAECPDGTVIRNGVEIIVNMRPNFTYTATALGIDGFDPIIGVGDQNGVSLCEDDANEAGRYAVELPSSGTVNADGGSSQVPFFHSYDSFTNVSLIIGSTDGSGGEFVLILEGMAVTEADGRGQGSGDPFVVRITQNMVDSGILNAYMISVTNDLDPLMQIADSDGNVITDSRDNPMVCDDAGDANTCWNTQSSLTEAVVVRGNNRGTPGGPRDSMLGFDLNGLSLDSDPDENMLRFLMTSYQQSSFGDYIVVFHTGTGDSGSSQAGVVPTPQGGKKGDTGGLTVECPNGITISNGVEIVVSMRPNFTYTATALGVDGFDPAIAVGDSGGISLCEDDVREAADYGVALPTSGVVEASRSSAQVPFFHSRSGFSDISLIVGSTDGSSGQFVLILEGMAVTNADGSGQGAGDPFSVRITPNMVSSGVPMSIYMISITNDLDPLMQLVDSDGRVLTDARDNPMACDDAGDANTCWNTQSNLSNSGVARGNRRGIPGGPRDSMLSFDLTGLELDPDPDANFLKFLMTSYQQSSFGDYIVVFNIGTAAGGSQPGNI